MIHDKILNSIVQRNISKDLQFLSSNGYNEVESDYKVMKNHLSPKNYFVISTILQYNGNSWIGSKYGVYPFDFNGNEDKKFDMSVCNGLWFKSLKNYEAI
jgi:hypothetical protein